VPDRILVYGVTGSGKTVLAERISRTTGIPWHAVDELTWDPGWIEVPEDEQRRRIAAICAGERWVLDTAYGKWLDVPLARVELIVALDFPRWRSLSRLIRRSVARAIDGKPICNGNRESFRNLLSRRSIVRWHFKVVQPEACAHQRLGDRSGRSDGCPLDLASAGRAMAVAPGPTPAGLTLPRRYGPAVTQLGPQLLLPQRHRDTLGVIADRSAVVGDDGDPGHSRKRGP
jgi:adenylate kinase family enzyme